MKHLRLYLLIAIITIINLNCGIKPSGELGKACQLGQNEITVEKAILTKSLIRVQPMTLLEGVYKDPNQLAGKLEVLQYIGANEWNSKPRFMGAQKGDGFLVLHIRVRDISKLGEPKGSQILLRFGVPVTSGDKLTLQPIDGGGMILTDVFSHGYIYNYDERVPTKNRISSSEYEIYLPYEISTEILQDELVVEMSKDELIKIKDKGLSKTENLYSNTVFKTVNW